MEYIQLVILLFLCAFMAFMFLFFFLPIIGYAPYYPSNHKAIAEMIKIANIQKTDKLVDLGSGDGRLIIYAAKNSHAAKYAGVEINPFLANFSRLKNLFLKNKVQYINDNIFDVDLSKYSVVFCYLWPKHMKKLEYKFQKELKPGSKVVTNSFHLKSREPVKSDGKVNLYVI